MESIIADMTHSTFLPAPVIWARFVGALLFGAVIGFERELRSRPAGLRTHALVAVAASAFAILATEVIHSENLGDNDVQIDPLRVIEAVTAGVAFLAAGFIVFAKGEVKGLTTGAGIWLAAAIGLSIGFGYWMIALPATILGVVVLALLRRFEGFVELKAPK
ncbi:membrane protein [Rhizobium albus]|nr:membrane protein [Rhizobium albus]